MTTLDRCPAWTTENLTTLGNDVAHLRTQLDWLLEDLADAPDARVGYLESQLAGFSSELERLDDVLDDLRLAMDEPTSPGLVAGDARAPLAAIGR
jgi:hypothetical protein